MDVSVIIVNFKTKELTHNCIDSVFQNTNDIEFEVILVDNNSRDGSAEFFSKDNRIKFVESHSNLGFGGANNLGYSHSLGDYIFCLNSDTILFENSIKILFDYYKKYAEKKKIGVLGAFMVDNNHTYNGSGHLLPRLSDYSNLILNKLMRRSNIPFPIFPEGVDCVEVECVTGADLFLSRKLVEEVGGLFDPAIFMYNEESELQLRIRKQKYHNYVIKSTSIIHLQGATLTAISNQISSEKYYNQLRMNIKSRNYMLKKHYSFIWRSFYYILRFICYAPIVLLGKESCSRKKEIIKILLRNE